jgi:hypothetical protein
MSSTDFQLERVRDDILGAIDEEIEAELEDALTDEDRPDDSSQSN